MTEEYRTWTGEWAMCQVSTRVTDTVGTVRDFAGPKDLLHGTLPARRCRRQPTAMLPSTSSTPLSNSPRRVEGMRQATTSAPFHAVNNPSLPPLLLASSP